MFRQSQQEKQAICKAVTCNLFTDSRFPYYGDEDKLENRILAQVETSISSNPHIVAYQEIPNHPSGIISSLREYLDEQGYSLFCLPYQSRGYLCSLAFAVSKDFFITYDCKFFEVRDAEKKGTVHLAVLKRHDESRLLVANFHSSIAAQSRKLYGQQGLVAEAFRLGLQTLDVDASLIGTLCFGDSNGFYGDEIYPSKKYFDEIGNAWATMFTPTEPSFILLPDDFLSKTICSDSRFNPITILYAAYLANRTFENHISESEEEKEDVNTGFNMQRQIESVLGLLAESIEHIEKQEGSLYYDLINLLKAAEKTSISLPPEETFLDELKLLHSEFNDISQEINLFYTVLCHKLPSVLSNKDQLDVIISSDNTNAISNFKTKSVLVATDLHLGDLKTQQKAKLAILMDNIDPETLTLKPEEKRNISILDNDFILPASDHKQVSQTIKFLVVPSLHLRLLNQLEHRHENSSLKVNIKNADDVISSLRLEIESLKKYADNPQTTKSFRMAI